MTPREQAALAVAHAETALLDARKALRDAVKAEIAAMPEVGDGEGFHAKVAALAVALGVPTAIRDDRNPYAEWRRTAGVALAVVRWNDGPRIYAHHPSTNGGAEFRIDNQSLDAALRLALTWLADRDVFVEVRR